MMKVKSLIPIFIIIPVLTWAPLAQGTKLGIGRIIGGVPVDIVTPGVGKVQIAPDLTTVGIPVILAIGIFDDAWNPVPLAHECQLNVVNSDATPFLMEDDPATPGAKRMIQLPKTIVLSNPIPGAATFQVYPYRATLYQDEGLSPDITQYRFVVKDITDPSVLSDTSFPLDSVIPEPFERVVLVIPGESHYPGDYIRSISGGPPYLGYPWDLTAGIPYEFKVYGTDQWGNTVPGMPGTLVWLERYQGSLAPASVLPPGQCSLDEIAKGISIAKRTFEAVYSFPGHAFLKACCNMYPHGIPFYGAQAFNVIAGANPDNMIVVIPNPIGNGTEAGPCAEISIAKVPIAGGSIRAKIFNQFGSLVKEFQDEDIKGMHDGSVDFWTITWCGDNDKGHKVGNGVYHFCVEIVQVEQAGIFRTKIGVAW